MGRIKLALPDNFIFSTKMNVRITDLNYGNHVGNDTILSYLHQARVAYLASLGYTEMNMENVGLIMGDVAIVYKRQVFYPSDIRIWVQAGEFGSMGFDLFYRAEITSNNITYIVAEGKTGMVCFDYARNKVCLVPEQALRKLRNM